MKKAAGLPEAGNHSFRLSIFTPPGVVGVCFNTPGLHPGLLILKPDGLLQYAGIQYSGAPGTFTSFYLTLYVIKESCFLQPSFIYNPGILHDYFFIISTFTVLQ
jgi:hypothetical protein